MYFKKSGLFFQPARHVCAVNGFAKLLWIMC